MDPFLAGLILATIVGYALTFWWNPSIAIAGLSSSISLILKASVWIISSIFFAGLLEQFLQKRFIYFTVGKQTAIGEIAIGTILGSVGTGSRWGVYPLASALLKTGFSKAGTIAFISAWFLISIPRIGAEIPFFGAKFVWVRVIVSLIVSFLAGMIAKFFFR